MLLADILQAFRKGRQVASPATWKNRALAINTLTALLVALAAVAKGLGYDLLLDPDTLEMAAGGIVALAAIGNSVVHVVSTTKIGLQPGPGAPDGAGADRGP
jgi:hypothetical protein